MPQGAPVPVHVPDDLNGMTPLGAGIKPLLVRESQTPAAAAYVFGLVLVLVPDIVRRRGAALASSCASSYDRARASGAACPFLCPNGFRAEASREDVGSFSRAPRCLALDRAEGDEALSTQRIK